MSEISDLIELISSRRDCIVRPVAREAEISSHLPADLKSFYEVCGGVELFTHAEYPLAVSAPNELHLSNEVIVGEINLGDITDSWVIIATGRSDEYVSLDTGAERLGWCYDSFWDRHGVAGSCPVIARSFSEFLRKSVECAGQRYYWLADGFQSYGDAYDD
ncbi:SMI1/KNR4 family protein [Xanthomonas cissicola]|uniref:SMI1/KNR4 family protein n=1 Tax=Xanthomonas cissicola TaxID=86186 RepID=UPI0009988C11|nr:SMI1/KNR4 family protein [Xanthomonas cissicola]KAB0537873.1 SMI1/KNR4 family protein [Xanthomonas cissicola]